MTTQVLRLKIEASYGRTDKGEYALVEAVSFFL
jgi:hypothetical protein